VVHCARYPKIHAVPELEARVAAALRMAARPPSGVGMSRAECCLEPPDPRTGAAATDKVISAITQWACGLTF